MKKRTLITICVMAAMIGLLSTCEDNAATPTFPTAEIETTNDSLSYAWGVQLAEALKQRTNDLDPDVVAAAVKEALEEKAQMSLEECQQVVTIISTRESQKALIENAKEGEAFLADNANKPGVITTPSGLQYKMLTEGTGESPTASNTVTVHYTGTFLDGEEFDSSVGGDPIEFPLNRVIRGWTEGVQLMKPGGKIKLFVPSDIAYGPQGRPGIPPNATLIFEIELLSFK